MTAGADLSTGVARVIDPAEVAASFRAEIRAEVAALPEPLVLWGVLADEHRPSRTYAEYTRKGCDDVGVHFTLKQVRRLDVESVIRAANADAGVHGVLVYYPVFGTEHDGEESLNDPLIEQLRVLEGEIRKNFAVSKTLREQLDEAVAREDYERAAWLRDQIRARARR